MKNGVGETEWYSQSFLSVGIGWFWALRYWSWLHKLLRRQRQWWSWCDPLYNEFYSPYGDVKNVASNRAGHGHVPKSLPGHYDTGDQVRDWSPSSQDGQTHDLFTNANCLSNLKAMTGANRGVWSHKTIKTTNISMQLPFNEFLLCAVLGVEMKTMNKPHSWQKDLYFNDAQTQEIRNVCTRIK